MSGPLAGVKVIDITHYGVGPWACTLLGQLGAEVIKVETLEGDRLSRFPPPYKNGITTVYISLNLNKQCIAVDLSDKQSQAAVRELVAQADILIDNHRPGYLDRRGLGYEDVKGLNPRLVYCACNGYGQRGPLRDMGSVDTFGQAVSGFASVSGPVGGPPEGLHCSGLIDLTTSIYIVTGVLAALRHRDETGQGQLVETSQMQAATAMSSARALEYFASGENPTPMGTGVGNIVPSRAFIAADDKWVSITALDDATWRRLATAVGLPELSADPRFDSNAGRVARRGEVEAPLEAAIRTRPSAEWITVLEEHKVPCGLFMNYNPLRIDAQVKEQQMLAGVDTHWGHVTVGGLPWRFSRTPGTIRATPRPGENTEAVLAGLPSRQVGQS
jgi:crotonobetainyl-CoA:carnitine CoA-transferase CaiB-like acyl-CoA transferase